MKKKYLVTAVLLAASAGVGVVLSRASRASEGAGDSRGERPPPLPAEQQARLAASLKGLESRYLLETNREIEQAQQAPSWDEFYTRCEQLRLDHSRTRRMILKRVAREIDLDELAATALDRLLEEEVEAVTAAAAETLAPLEILEGKAYTLTGTENQEFWDGLAQLRRSVRMDWDDRFLELLGKEGCDLVREHLRNDEIWISTSRDGAAVTRRIEGHGR